MNKEYWENYYKISNTETEPSCFAKYVLAKYIKKGDIVLELGCGNGRDSIYFANNGIYTTAIDQCKNVTKYLKNCCDNKILTFKKSDFTELGDIGFFNHIYSRFTFHAITCNEQIKVFEWSNKYILKGGKLLIEVRSTKNELYGLGIPVENEKNAYIYNNHFRRFVEKNEFCEQIKSFEFNILECNEDKGFAPFKNENQIFLRVIAQRM